MTSLWLSISSQTAMDDSRHLSILANPGPGYSPHEPMALVAMISGEDRSPKKVKSTAKRLPKQGRQKQSAMRYVYYRVYKKHDAVVSRQPASSSDPYIGRLSIEFIPPPRTAASVMRCISKNEELDHSNRSQLFSSVSSESPLEKDVLILSSDHPGSTLDDPMAFVDLPAPITSSINGLRSHKLSRSARPNTLRRSRLGRDVSRPSSYNFN